MKTLITVKEQFAKNVLEFLCGTNIGYIFTEVKDFNGTAVAHFVCEGDDEDIEFFNKWIRGAFSTSSAQFFSFKEPDTKRIDVEEE